MSNEKPNKTFKAECVSLSLMSVTGHSVLAPLGMSMFTHLNDGCIDLILVRNTHRHEFVRYLRRHGNRKNQVNLSGVEEKKTKKTIIICFTCSFAAITCALTEMLVCSPFPLWQAAPYPHQFKDCNPTPPPPRLPPPTHTETGTPFLLTCGTAASFCVLYGFGCLDVLPLKAKVLVEN